MGRGRRDAGGAGITATAGALTALALAAFTGRATAHSGSMGGSVVSATVPTWLTILTGGIVVGGSFLFTTLLTDHEEMRGVNWRRLTVSMPARVRRVLGPLLRTASFGALLVVIATGAVGPREPTRNFALLVVWVGWWAGYTATAYLVGNTWPLLDPWRAAARLLRRGRDRLRGSGGSRTVPRRWGVWPAVAGLLGLVWLEVVSPVGQNPRSLAVVVLVYSLATVAGAVRYGDEWFERVDPVGRVFAAYGRVAPLQFGGADDGGARESDGDVRSADGSGSVSVRLPGTALTEEPLPDRPGEVAFVVALLWVTTYDGLVATPAWAAAVDPVVGLGAPALLVYAVALLAGFAGFFAVYRLAARAVRRTADTYVTARAIERWFAPALLPIAAGYHLAHFLGYFLGLAPAFGAVALSPFAPPANTLALVLPGWFATAKLCFVLVGHVLAIWVAHSLAFELFPGVLAAVRSQYPSAVVMVFYTMSSLWVITQPYVPPPYV